LAPAKNSNVLVYDLRYDPSAFIDLSAKELAAKLFASWDERKKEDFVRVPVKELQYNRAPAVAPLGVLEQSSGWEKIGLTLDVIEKHKALLVANPQFAENIRSAFESREEYKKSKDPEAMLYDGFLPDKDRMRVEVVRNATERELSDFHPEFSDERLSPLLLHYKARNFPKILSESEVVEWEVWRSARLTSQLPGFMKSISAYATSEDDSIQFIMRELQLWAESILPVEDY
jgi:exodeoxyribonuclease-1